MAARPSKDCAARAREDIIKIQRWVGQFWQAGKTIQDPEIQKLVDGLAKARSALEHFM